MDLIAPWKNKMNSKSNKKSIEKPEVLATEDQYVYRRIAPRTR